jgi:hypothetical protein
MLQTTIDRPGLWYGLLLVPLVAASTPIRRLLRAAFGRSGRGLAAAAAGKSGSNELQRRTVMTKYNPTLDMLCKFLDEDQVSYRTRDDGERIDLSFTTRTAVFQAQIACPSDEDLLGVFITLPVLCPEALRVKMAEATTRANYGLWFGSFHMDMSDGQMLYVSCMPTGEAGVSGEQFRRLLYGALTAADRYLRAFNRLIYADDLSPAEVIAEVEMQE